MSKHRGKPLLALPVAKALLAALGPCFSLETSNLELLSLGFRHDLHCSVDDFSAHAHWLLNNGMGLKVQHILTKLVDLEIVSPVAKTMEAQLAEAFEYYGKFWGKACLHLYQSSSFTLEDQKYWALQDLESNVRDEKFTTGIHRFHHVLVDEFQDINPLDLNGNRSHPGEIF
jgi:DNA helicase-2/ATP-dependent DNA helicase PcrA